MNNCLVTKLKGAVDNDNLFKLNEVRFDVSINGQTSYNFGTKDLTNGTSAFHIKVVSQDGYINGNKEMTISSADNYFTLTADSYPATITFSIIPKANVGIISGVFYNDAKSIGYMTKLKKLSLDGFKNNNIKSLDIQDLSNIEPTNFIRLTLPQWFTIKNAALCSRFYNLQRLGFNRTTSEQVINIENILDAWVTAGRNSGSCTITGYSSTGYKYNGSSFTEKTFTFDNTGWHEATN